MINKFYKISLFLFVCLAVFIITPAGFADYDYRADKERQIQILKYNIKNLESEILNNRGKIEQLKSEFESYKNEVLLNKELLNDVEMSDIESANKLIVTDNEIKGLTDKVEKLKSAFKQRILWMYKQGMNYDSEVMFTAKSLNDLSVKMEYLNRFSEYRRKDFEKLRKVQYLLEEKKKMFGLGSRERNAYLSGKRDEQKSRYEMALQTQAVITQLTDDNFTYRRQINRYTQDLDNLTSLVGNINENFVVRINQDVDYELIPFDRLKRRLIIPVQSTNILFDYGESISPETGKTVSYNNGVDVSIAKGSDVKCVADGVVEEIRFVPAYGDVVLVNHGGGYRTLYAILENIYVKLNSPVKAGQVIATTGENLNGQSFHFELWKDSTPQDPKMWVRR